MAEIGYTLSCEEHPPRDLVHNARLAERAGFSFAMISDHFHPWIGRQGQSPFVWSVLGGISQSTETLRVGTGVTCPTIRIHPAIVAQAAATTATMMPGRFFLGVGSGENLNEHITGAGWPEVEVRQEMLEEAIEVIRLLWQGGVQSHRGKHYTVENAEIYTLPDEPIEIMVAAAGPKAIEQFEAAGGKGKPRFGQLHVCWAETEDEARRIAYEHWPNTALPGTVFVELPLPQHFEQMTELISEDDVAESVICGPDVDRHVEAITEFTDAGYDHVYIHQVGPDQQGCIDFYARDVLPRLTEAGLATLATS